MGCCKQKRTRFATPAAKKGFVENVQTDVYIS